MYPYFRALRVLVKAKYGSTLELTETSEINLRVMISDVDLYPELNNGRHLTMMDLGRYDYGMRLGLFSVLKRKKWGLMVAGNFTRYRRRLMLFKKYILQTELVGYDDKWFYFYQKTVRRNIIHSAALVRTAVVSSKGIVSAELVAKELGMPYEPSIPKWVEEWINLNEVSPKIV